MTRLSNLRVHSVVLSCLLLVGAACAMPVRAQQLAGDTRGVVGYSNFLDEGPLHHFVTGGAVRLYLTRRLAVEPELLYMYRSERDKDLVFQPNVTYDFRDRSRRVIPYLTGGVGVLHHSGGNGYIDFSSVTATASVGAGARIFVSKNVFISPEFRIGWEPIVRATVAVGYAFGR